MSRFITSKSRRPSSLTSIRYTRPAIPTDIGRTPKGTTTTQLGRPNGTSAYLRLSTRPVDQNLAAVPEDPAARERRRRQVVAGGYTLRRHDDPQVTIAAMGAMMTEAVTAADRLEQVGNGFTLLRFADVDVAPIVAAAADRKVALEVVDVRDDHARRLYQRDLVLIRPDQHVAWRDDTAPNDPGVLIDRVRGATSPVSGPTSVKGKERQ
jgi:hypothetical protein